MDERKLEVRVGAFVLLGIAGVIGLLWLMGELHFTREASLQVLFSHTGNVTRGAPVKVGGVQVGRVERIDLDLNRRDDRGNPLPVRMEVSLDPAAREVIHQDAQVTVGTVGPLGEPYLELSPGSLKAPALPPGEPLRGTDAPRLDLVALRLSSFLEASSKLMEDNPDSIAAFFNGVAGLSGNMGEVIAENREDIRGLIGEMSAAAKDLRALAAAANRQLQPGGRTDQLISDASSAAKTMRTDLPQLSQEARTLLTRLDKVSEPFTEEDARRLKAAIEHYSAAGDKLDQLAARGNRILARIEAGEGTIGRLQKDPKLYEDVKALIEDLRSHPWKILRKE